MANRIAWSRRVTREFCDMIVDIAIDLELPADYLMACIAFESGKSFRSDIVNLAGSGATGLIQFMPSTARRLGTTTKELAKMTPEQQLHYVHLYFKPYKGKLKTVEDVYMAILWPRAIGKPSDYVLFNINSMPTTYRQNSGLDYDKDGNVTKFEACAKVRAFLAEGQRDINVRVD